MTALATNAASWEATVDGPDVFGKTKVIAIESNSRNALIVQCDSAGERVLAYIEPKKEFEDVPELPSKFYLKASDAAPILMEATSKSWNDNYMGIVVTAQEHKLEDAIRAIKEARTKIDVGVELMGQQYSASFSSRGSSKAMERVQSVCKSVTE